MKAAYSVEEIRRAEHALMARVPEGTLMRRAAGGLAAACVHLLTEVYGSRVVLLIGGGANGGDALYAGAVLARRGARVDAILAGAKTHPGGLAALRAAGGRIHDAVGEDSRIMERADLIVDGLVGIGGVGALRQPQATLAALAARARARVVAVDVPSGVDASSGVVAGAAVRADLTVTFGGYKTGLLVDPGASHTGTVELVDIGLGPYLRDPDLTALEASDVAELLPTPAAESDKYRRGVLGVAAGSAQYSGAAVLAVGGALRGGAGLVRFDSTDEPVRQVRAHWPEAVIGPGRVQAWVIGPGFGTGRQSLERLRAVLDSDVPVLVDADALTLCAADPTLLDRPAPTLITPHAGELARLLGESREFIEGNRLEAAGRAAAELGATVLVKGSTTLIAQEGHAVRVNLTGTPWLAAGGTGDVLSGLAGALLAGGLSAYDAASAAAYLHGLAGRIAASGDGKSSAPITAGDVLAALPAAIRSVRDASTFGAPARRPAQT
ncbi:NAD(P)H-hydrate dehydratase [Rhizohabitans arisaemae]|uniref:NAD(P)H-hydrate dehydratase n=1 Tax=Rhizohabitans arisaemae TaxID=2720610 RepID=UPI0024B0E784|nr:NAD(P)H-hydrate dehydratase [Rhizohabitans arisaemae]